MRFFSEIPLQGCVKCMLWKGRGQHNPHQCLHRPLYGLVTPSVGAAENELFCDSSLPTGEMQPAIMASSKIMAALLALPQIHQRDPTYPTPKAWPQR